MQLLKHSLSKTLVPFYPLAGKAENNLHINCNDDGVYYVQARANIQLSEFLKHPENQLIHRLLPFHPGSIQLLSQNYLAMIQITIVDCGGIAIGMYTSHKVVDGLSWLTFMKAWAATARGHGSEQFHPCFVSPSLFPSDFNLLTDSCLIPMPPAGPLNLKDEWCNCTTKRFVFDCSPLAALKAKAARNSSTADFNATSTRAVMALLWKAYINSTSGESNSGINNQGQSVLAIMVNLRARTSPPLPPNSFGNIFWIASAQTTKRSNDLELQSLVQKISNGISTMDNDFLEGIKGENRTQKLLGTMVYLNSVRSNNNREPFAITSICKSGVYEVDFGWGKPIWSCMGSAGTDLYGLGNRALLMDTRFGDGIEAWVSLKEEEMGIFEKNKDLLAFASLNPSPLQC